MPETVRRPVVAGQFYEGYDNTLRRQIARCYERAGLSGGKPDVNENGPREIVGLVSPHAGYQFSGGAAAAGFARLAEDGRPDVFVLIGPSHGRGMPSDAIQTSGYWQTPLGNSPIAEGVASRIASSVRNFADDAGAFAGEHSLEVQLPFIQDLYGVEAEIVPVMMYNQDEAAARRLGGALSEALEDEDAVMIASTDMTHFQSAEVAREQDEALMELMEELDPVGMLRERQQRGISMCGYGPVAAMMLAAKDLGATRAETIAYTNSGDVTGSHREVVGYLSMEVRKG